MIYHLLLYYHSDLFTLARTVFVMSYVHFFITVSCSPRVHALHIYCIHTYCH